SRREVVQRGQICRGVLDWDAARKPPRDLPGVPHEEIEHFTEEPYCERIAGCDLVAAVVPHDQEVQQACDCCGRLNRWSNRSILTRPHLIRVAYALQTCCR